MLEINLQYRSLVSVKIPALSAGPREMFAGTLAGGGLTNIQPHSVYCSHSRAQHICNSNVSAYLDTLKRNATVSSDWTGKRLAVRSLSRVEGSGRTILLAGCRLLAVEIIYLMELYRKKIARKQWPCTKPAP